MHEAFGLRATLLFDLAPGEYHTNVVLAVLAGRAALICPDGFADPAVVDAIAACYAPHTLRLSAGEHAAFAGNAIALSGGYGVDERDRRGWRCRLRPAGALAACRLRDPQRGAGCDRSGGRVAALLCRGAVLIEV